MTNAPQLSRREFAACLGLSAGALFLGTSPRRLLASQETPDVLVLGAGLAGLSAALRLKRAGARVVLIEAKDRVGGRAYTLEDLPDRPEIGGVEIGNSYTRLRAWADEFGLEMQRSAFPSGTTLHVDGITMDASEWPESSLNPLTGDTRPLLPSRLENFYLSQDNPLPSAESWDQLESVKYDVSISEALRARGASETALELINIAGTFNHSDRMSVLSRWRRARLFESETGVGRLAAGTGELPKAMANSLDSHQLMMETPIVAIDALPDGVRVETVQGQVIQARHCICTLTVPALRQVRLNVPLSPIQSEAIQKMEYTKVTTAMIDAEPFWEDDGLPPNMWTDTPIERLFPRTDKRTGEIIGLKLFVNGDGTDALDDLDDTAFEEVVLGTLAEVRPASKGRTRLRFRKSWGRDPFAGGAYVAWPPGKVAAYRSAFQTPAGPLLFAGEHTALDSIGMEGAVRAGERAADLVLAA